MKISLHESLEFDSFSCDDEYPKVILNVNSSKIILDEVSSTFLMDVHSPLILLDEASSKFSLDVDSSNNLMGEASQNILSDDDSLEDCSFIVLVFSNDTSSFDSLTTFSYISDEDEDDNDEYYFKSSITPSFILLQLN